MPRWLQAHLGLLTLEAVLWLVFSGTGFALEPNTLLDNPLARLGLYQLFLSCAVVFLAQPRYRGDVVTIHGGCLLLSYLNVYAPLAWLG